MQRQKKNMCGVWRRCRKRVCQNWFVKFRAGDTTCEDRKRSGRPLVMTKSKV